MKTIIKRPIKKYIVAFAIAFLVTVGSGDAMAISLSFSFTDAAGTTNVNQVTNTVSGSLYYGYNTIDVLSANTIDGLEDSNSNTVLFFMYENTSTGDISLGVIADQPNDVDGGMLRLGLSGIPPFMGVIEVMDDPGDGGSLGVGTSVSGSQLFSWAWAAQTTDGMMLGDLGGEWNINVTIIASTNIDSWQFVDYTGGSASMIDLDVSGGFFTISSRTVAVPEPSTLLLLGSGLIGLAFFRRKEEI